MLGLICWVYGPHEIILCSVKMYLVGGYGKRERFGGDEEKIVYLKKKQPQNKQQQNHHQNTSLQDLTETVILYSCLPF